jgi:hypothetical protein
MGEGKRRIISKGFSVAERIQEHGESGGRYPFLADWRDQVIRSFENDPGAVRFRSLSRAALLRVGYASMMHHLDPRVRGVENNQKTVKLRKLARELEERIDTYPKSFTATAFPDIQSFFNSQVAQDSALRQAIHDDIEKTKVVTSKVANLRLYYLHAAVLFLEKECGLVPTTKELASILDAGTAGLGREPHRAVDPESIARKLRRFRQDHPELVSDRKRRKSVIQLILNLPI